MAKGKKVSWRRGLVALVLTIAGIILILAGIINRKITFIIFGVIMIFLGFSLGWEGRVFKSMLNTLPSPPGA